MKISFGKYKDTEIYDVPTDYLIWCLERAKRMRKADKTLITEELQRRVKELVRETNPQLYKRIYETNYLGK